MLSMLFPAEQGLKLINQILALNGSDILSMLFPAEQGLKHYKKSKNYANSKSLNAISSRTRIETKMQYIGRVILDTLSMLFPAEQGLKRSLSRHILRIFSPLNAISSRTRIETFKCNSVLFDLLFSQCYFQQNKD